MSRHQGGAATPTELPVRDRLLHERWLLELTQEPTAAGREWRVVEWIRRWVAERPGLVMKEDRAGNLVVSLRKPWGGKARGGKSGGRGGRPVFITAHLDHPGFVVERVIGPGTLELAFRGGVNDDYFESARVVVHIGGNGPDDERPVRRLRATLTGEGSGVTAAGSGERLFKTYIAELEDEAEGEAEVRIGDVATWDLPPAEIDGQGLVHTAACDDLAAAAAALAAYDTLLKAHGAGRAVQDVRLLFTRSEEIGFTGAIAACKLGTMPRTARVVALENSRSFADSPIGGGPIVRVGDRLTVFHPGLTAACAKRAEEISGHAATARATERTADAQRGMRWQRKLMAGGACEATVYCAYGYEATCLCLPLGNYHNMADLQAVQDRTYDRARLGPPRVAREFISVEDYHGLVDLLVAIGLDLPAQDPVVTRIERLYERHAFVLEEGGAGLSGRARGKGAAARGKKVAKGAGRRGGTRRGGSKGSRR